MTNIEKVIQSGICYGCTACSNICPQKCIDFVEDEEGFSLPKINTNRCIDCMLCESVCIALVKKDENKNKILKAFVGWSKSVEVRFNSSSGGIYSEIVNSILNLEGNVYGAIYDSASKTIKYTSSDFSSFKLQRKSKYVEAQLDDTFIKVRDDLDSGRQVLFSGTPCYVSGLKRFLQKDYPNLYTCDFICHGRPSPGVFRIYISHIEKINKSEILEIDFRPKTFGWTRLRHLEIRFKNGVIQRYCCLSDPFFRAFISNKSLRKSCMRCQFSKSVHDADITLADYWDYINNKQIVNDGRGISMIICNTVRGAELISKIDRELHLIQIEDKDYKYAFHERTELNYNFRARKEYFEYIKHVKHNIDVLKIDGNVRERFFLYLKNKLIKIIILTKQIRKD